ncbi:POC1 centriolar protein A [Ceratobasidium sp. 414]|nr:POC1 centriolar protein A [Ceratobasidium sp. 414]
MASPPTISGMYTPGNLSVAYSPDGAYIVSGSSDSTIRIWDAHTGQPVGRPLKGHTHPVTSVAYSPDGARIVSSSYDHTIRIWDAHTGQPVGQPLKGHASPANSIAYSPDGANIVSGSSSTIRIWDAHTGQPIGQPLNGHTDSVNSVAYSPDGAHVVSSSDDRTIRIWNAHTGQPVGQPLNDHRLPVKLAAYSPDGAYIVSRGDDGRIRIWSITIGGHTDGSQLIQSATPPPGHASTVSSPTQHRPSVAKPTTGPTPDQLSKPKVATLPRGWFMNLYGWLVNLCDERVVWVPHYARAPGEGLRGQDIDELALDFDDAKLGEDWKHCFDTTCVD